MPLVLESYFLPGNIGQRSITEESFSVFSYEPRIKPFCPN